MCYYFLEILSYQSDLLETLICSDCSSVVQLFNIRIKSIFSCETLQTGVMLAQENED